MSTEEEILDRAVEYITQEQLCLQRECEAFREFRDTVSRARVAPRDESTTGTETGQLLDAYRETVMSTPDFETAYGESIRESLETEFTPSLANTLLSDGQVTQQFKRNLLMATNTAIDRRIQFQEVLEQERESLETTRGAISDIDATLQELPACSIRQLPFEEFVDVWERCETLIERCDRLSEERQRTIDELQHPGVGPDDERHVLNSYLYSELETTFPALRAIAEMRGRIERYRGTMELSEGGQRPGDTDDGYERTITNGSSD